MPSTYVASNAVATNASVAGSTPIAAVTDEVRPQPWADEQPLPLLIRDRTKTSDDLDGARGILVAVMVGAVAWIAIGWGALGLIERLFG